MMVKGVDAELFLAYLEKVAAKKRDDAAYGGYHTDGGASALEREIAAFRGGLIKAFPAFWAADLEQFQLEQNADYQTYLTLKKRFEPHGRP